MTKAQWTHKHLLDLDDVSRAEIELIIETARSFKEVSSRDVKKVPVLRGKTVVLLFFEPSTRTRVSFELAAKRLSADTLSIAANVSSVTKGETVLDTALNIEAMNVDAMVVRHQSSGVPQILANGTKTVIINAGDGCRAQTQLRSLLQQIPGDAVLGVGLVVVVHGHGSDFLLSEVPDHLSDHLLFLSQAKVHAALSLYECSRAAAGAAA